MRLKSFTCLQVSSCYLKQEALEQKTNLIAKIFSLQKVWFEKTFSTKINFF